MPIQINKTVIFLMGPTASGKTNLAIKLSQQFKTRLISVDSALIYKGMNIGTAKPDKATLKKYPHYLINICSPESSYSVFDFIRDANKQIKTAFAKNELPILVGGTSFYFHVLEHGLSNLPESSTKSKEKFNQLLRNKGTIKLHQDLKKIDPQAANKIHPNDSQRIIRALEVFNLSGKTISELQGNKKPIIDYPIKKIILMPKRNELHTKIETRFLLMMKNGFLNEVQHLKQNPNLHQNLSSIRCVGYRQAWQYLNGKIDKTEMIEKIIIATRQLCKRQITWLKSEKYALVLNNSNLAKAVTFINS
ncbi:tRNA (adenosine(37)-N6)-dimethylallyltransferase MiaA [Candidatus Vesicomyidisocius calyptogenae]|uniref:tRNA dimethylallyltransferase n=1 Tax=Vesicomyosocius okutanii subsp. Calyptogena okutanii (strain HA) TaxID=412965 RepID=MIAA_VESOH|nr:tRNA (adenosine(37)-N6)-dimethylallyltransferase MiaA [Candidatus Vesicomyosocius okutanii]A5CW57.1 RecName: Full=tRNA dimethylallyltransferase; AltName: Full=Dimethylallyl diphosphate:tRNA dimethylallyltransferase; Short=DMAPP:tRNA dimethylallyltransferase; Short=DMATase; AltName: Full=Isopentenyl-diphosphate:tRNA isopentenyltransferase; Short=IPP transferase; Short=IPPT; Short=IPTase [Candidatus Vesicomyosocius okutanii]BAF61815.1 tRNA delta(2)-isopentenylpyrophosphate transferase [Candidatu